MQQTATSTAEKQSSFIPTTEEPFEGMRRPSRNDDSTRVQLESRHVGLTRGGYLVYISGRHMSVENPKRALPYYNVVASNGFEYKVRMGGYREGWAASRTGHHRDIVHVFRSEYMTDLAERARNMTGGDIPFIKLPIETLFAVLQQQVGEGGMHSMEDIALATDIAALRFYIEKLDGLRVHPEKEPPVVRTPKAERPKVKRQPKANTVPTVKTFDPADGPGNGNAGRAIRQRVKTAGSMVYREPSIANIMNGAMPGGQVFSISKEGDRVNIVIGAYGSNAVDGRCGFTADELEHLISELQDVLGLMD